ncbi:Hypothetical_protein [Hexamita inflata]|uniref:Hypothetical_protein n=1 Tax=Hexamita inflata TaxID=28002 RepID=A0AA86VTC0_9EUKA|nr:Hypothetical protein HINF_LOCUS64848 [Hexamita inflata]
MSRNQNKSNLKSRKCHLETIVESQREYKEQESSPRITRANSYECLDEEVRPNSVVEVRNLIQLTAFEVHNVKRRVNQLIGRLDILKYDINIIQCSQENIVDFIARSSEM